MNATESRRLIAGEEFIDLAGGEWEATVAVCNLWHPKQYAMISADREITIPLWPSGHVRFRARSRTKSNIERLTLAFQQVLFEPAEQGVQGESDCVGNKHEFDCIAPAGVFDIRLRPDGHIPRVFPAVRVTPGEPATLGDLVFAEGHSIIGEIELPENPKADVAKSEVVAIPTALSRKSGPTVPGAALLKTTSKVSKRGWFQLDGVLPGEYIITARNPSGLFSDRVRVTVREGVDVRLNQPLRLRKPAQITLSVSPALTPKSQPWLIELGRSEAMRTVSVTSESRASLDGVWKSPPLLAGEYRVQIIADDGQAWRTEAVTLAETDRNVEVSLNGQTVRGTVTLGSRPVAVTLAFSNSSGAYVTTRSREDGTFSVELPDSISREWNVAADDDGGIHSTLRGVSIPASTPDGPPLLIELPATAVTGTVIGHDGNPLALALLTVHSMSDVTLPVSQPSAGSDGTFVLLGLARGKYSVVAESPTEKSDATVVDVGDAASEKPLTIVTHLRDNVSGHVMSEFGPVAGASVYINDPTAALLSFSSVITAADGSFSMPVRAQAGEFEVIVAAPGFAYLIDRVAYQSREVLLSVDQRGGLIIIRSNANRPLFLRRGDVSIPLQLVELQWNVLREVDSDATVTVRLPMMAPGSYGVCGSTAVATCSFGTLDPFGTLTFDARRTNAADQLRSK